MLKDEILAKLDSVAAAQSALKANILQKGITAAENDHIPTLAEKVGEIENMPYAVEGQITLVSSSAELTVSNLPQKPVEVGIASKTLAEADIVSNTPGFVVPSIHAVFPDTGDSVAVEECVITRTLDSTSGTWSLTFSFAAYNAAHPDSLIKLQGGYIYSWLVLFHLLYEEES